MREQRPESSWESKLSWRQKTAVGLAVFALPLMVVIPKNNTVESTPTSVSIAENDGLDIYAAKLEAQKHATELLADSTADTRAEAASRSAARTAIAQCFDINPKQLHHTLPEQYDNIQLACELAKNEPWAKNDFTRQFSALVQIWDRESGWDEEAYNKGSDAGGIPQAMPKSKMGAAAQHDAAKQIKWGLNYIKDRYKDPLGALAHWDSEHWY
ncbi:MAG: hypothetical protein U0491_03895 [Candidatus Saccharimonadales bacterium]